MKEFRFFKQCVACGAMALAMQVSAVTTGDYSMFLTYTLDSSKYSGDSIDGVHVALRLSENIPGFRYADCAANGADLCVTDGDGNVIAHDLENWNTAGESVVWVKMPTFAANKKLRVYYKGPVNEDNVASSVWSGYVGVWHMGETSGSVTDSTGNGYTMEPKDASAAQNVATPGPVGNGRVNCTSGQAYLAADNCKDLKLGSSFWVSGWFNVYNSDFSSRSDHGQVVLMTNKASEWGTNGFALRLVPGTSTDIRFQGKNNNPHENVVAKNVPMDNAWAHVTAVYGSGDKVRVYVNGIKVQTYRGDDDVATDWVSSASDSSHPLGLGYISEGGRNDGYSHPLWGAYDEVRYGDGELSDRRAYAEFMGQTKDLFRTEVGAQGMASALTTDYDASTAKLTITGTVTADVPEGTKVSLLADVAAGRDPADNLIDAKYVVETKTVSAAGDVSFEFQGTLGTRIAYQIALGEVAAGRILPATERQEMMLKDNVQYCWQTEVEDGAWENPDNWYFWPPAPTDGLPRCGFPSYGASFRFLANQTHVVTVNGKYTDLGDSKIDNSGLNLTLIGTVPGASLLTGGIAFANDEHIVLDAIAVSTGDWEIRDNSSLEMKNGASLSSKWNVKVNGANARMKVTSGSSVYVSTDDWWYGLQFQGANAEIEIDEATINAQHLFFNPNQATSVVEKEVGPKGIVFKGANPKLIVRRRTMNYIKQPEPMVFTFVVPETGYTEAPIQRGKTADDPEFLERFSDEVTPIRFAIDKASPAYEKQQKLHMPIVDWTYNGTAYAIGTAGIDLVTPKYDKSGSGWRYTPADGEAKSCLSLDLIVTKALIIVIR